MATPAAGRPGAATEPRGILSAADPRRRPLLGQVDARRLAADLAGPGLWLDVGATTLHVRGDAPGLAAQIAEVYHAFEHVTDGGFADVHLRLRPARGLRRWIRPQVVLTCDAQMPFDPFPADHPLPLMEWACNWMIGHRLHDLLLLHAGALERDGLAVLMPALPGSGKSTLTAALAHSGWRLLSDEFGAVDLASGQVRALLKPVALKNQSIDVIRGAAPLARLGPLFPNTRKGTVAHVAPPADAVARRHQPATPALVLLPYWEAGSRTELRPLAANEVFGSLAFNAFNYGVTGGEGFDAVVGIVQRSLAFSLRYGDLADARQALLALWPEVRAHAARMAAGDGPEPLADGAGSDPRPGAGQEPPR